MKKTLVWGLIACLVVGLLVRVIAQSVRIAPAATYYYSYSTKIPLYNVPDQVVVRYAEAPAYRQIATSTLQRVAAGSQVQWRDARTAIITTASSNGIASLLTMSTTHGDVLSSVPLYRFATGASFAVTEEFNVKFLPTTTKAQIAELARKTNSTAVWSPVPDVIVMRAPKGGNALTLANFYQESGLVEFAHPNFLGEGVGHQAPNDEYYARQFYLRNTGQAIADGHTGTAGADIKAEAAWNITRGSSSIVVAVIDDGVSADHPDLPNSRQIRLTNSNFTGEGNANDPSPLGFNAHGNHCAGIIAATQNNGEGISGIAPLCRIMPLRLLNMRDEFTDYNQAAAAITRAWQNGADIISNSYGSQGGQMPSNSNPTMTQAVRNAIQQGRGGRGCVVLFSAGNTAAHAARNNSNVSNPDGFVSYPANIDVVGVIRVAASDRTDHQADYSPTSIQGNSNNQFVDIAAPSHRAYPFDNNSQRGIAGETFEIYSIDTEEPANGLTGDNPWPAPLPNSFRTVPPQIGEVLPNAGTNFRSYTARFGGTSAACPQVAGAAALLLSYYPALTQDQVYRLLGQTADKVGGYSYAYGGRSNELGYGRINIGAALSALCGQSTGLYSTSPVYSTYDTGNALQSFQIVPTGQRYYIYLNQPYNFNFSALGPNSAPFPITKTGPQTAYIDFSNAVSVQVLATPASAPCSAQSSYVFRAPFNYRMAPNPVSSNLIVTETSAESSTGNISLPNVTSALKAFDANLYDMQGRRVRTQRSSQGKASLDVHDLPAGPYILRVGQGQDAYSEHVQISH